MVFFLKVVTRRAGTCTSSADLERLYVILYALSH